MVSEKGSLEFQVQKARVRDVLCAEAPILPGIAQAPRVGERAAKQVLNQAKVAQQVQEVRQVAKVCSRGTVIFARAMAIRENTAP